MIFAGIPRSREEWPSGVLEHLQTFRQGDVVEGFPLPYIGNPEVPVHSQTEAYRNMGSGTIEFKDDFPYGMITTQTCDIREEDSKQPVRPWVQMVPVYDGEQKHEPTLGSTKQSSYIPSNLRRFITEGREPQYLLYLPGFPKSGFWVADLRISVSVDKGWLLRRAPISVFESEEDRRNVGRRLAMLADRPAFDGRFERAVRRPLLKGLISLEDAKLRKDIHQEVAEFRINADDNISMKRVEIWVLSNYPLSEPVKKWFDEQAGHWEGEAIREGLNLLPVRYSPLEEINAKTYRSMTMMPLHDLTPNPPWYHN